MTVYSSELESDHPQGDVPFHEFMLRRMEQLQQMAEDPDNEDVTYAFINGEIETEVITHELILKHSKALGSWFMEQGYQKGDRVLLCMHNCWQYAVACLGAWSAGLVISPTSPQFNSGEIFYQLEDAEACVVVCDAHSLAKIEKALGRFAINPIKQLLCVTDDLVTGNVVLFSDALATSTTVSPRAVSLRDLLMLPYSSGTTGRPKGVMITHANYSYMILNYLKKATSDGENSAWGRMFVSPKMVTYLPIYHALGIFQLMSNLYNGTCQIMMATYNENLLLQKIFEHEVWVLASIPSILNSLAQNPLLEEMASSLLVIGSGAAPLHQSTIDKIQGKLPGVKITQGYGMTEMSTASHFSDGGAEPSSIGKLVPGTQMKIINEDGQPCSPGEQGEIYVKGPQVMAGYWRKGDETVAAFDSDGFLKTGDIGYVDENNYTYITDRMKELIKVNGKQVAPSELENVINSLHSVKEVSVIGVFDELRGEVPMAIVVAKPGPSQDELKKEVLNLVKGALAPYKQLRGGVALVDELPKTPNGKVKRRELRLKFDRSLQLTAQQSVSKL